MPRMGTSLCVAVFFIALLVATPCYSQTGICCFENYDCEVMTEEECAAAGGIHWVEGETCEPEHPCHHYLGGCCYPPTWECFILSEEECSRHEDYIWFEGETCEPAP